MENTVIDMLVYDNTEELSSSFNLPSFEAKMLCELYKHLNGQLHRKQMVDRIISGFYSKEEEINNMARFFVKKMILNTQDRGKSFLMQKCGLNEIDAYTYSDKVNIADRTINDFLSADLDTSTVEFEMNNLLEQVSSMFLNNGEKKVLK